MRAVVLLVICGSVLFSVAGFYPMYKIEQSAIRRQIKTRMKKGVPESELHYISFKSADEIDWTRPGKEFKLNNHMYDVVHTEEGNDLGFYCINDVEETLLFKHLEDYVRDNMRDHHKPIQKSGKTILQLIKIQNGTESVSPIGIFVESSTKQVLPTYTDLYSKCFLSITSPPPKA